MYLFIDYVFADLANQTAGTDYDASYYSESSSSLDQLLLPFYAECIEAEAARSDAWDNNNSSSFPSDAGVTTPAGANAIVNVTKVRMKRGFREYLFYGHITIDPPVM